MITFRDAADPTALVGADYVAIYGNDCDHPTPPEDAAKWDMAHKRYITFAGHPACSIIDYEKYTRDFNDPAVLRAWLEGRIREDRERESWVYADLSNARNAAAILHGLHFRWWIATLDGVRRSPNQLADLMHAWGTETRPQLIAANQWRTVPGTVEYDESVCFVDRDW